MNRHKVRFRPLCGRVVGLVIPLATLMLIGCAVTYTPSYQRQIIQQQAKNQPALGWVYPSYETLQRVPPEAGLNGVEKPRPLPAFVPDREPAYVSGMTLLADGSVVCVSPRAYTYEPKQFTIATYYRERIPRVQVNCFNGDTGILKWSTPLAVEGVCDITEMKAILLFSAKNFDKMGAFIATHLIALDKTNGTIRWSQRLAQPLRYFSISQAHHRIVLSAKSSSLDAAETVTAIDTITGKTVWSAEFAASGNAAQKRNVWPTIVGDNLLLFEKGPSLRRLQNGAVIWSREDIELSGFAQPLVFDDTAWLQSTQGIVALDATSGKTRWVAPAIVGQLMKITFSGTHLFLSSSRDGVAAAKRNLAMVDPSSGKVRWQVATAPLLGNIVADPQHVHFSTRSELVTLRTNDGTEVRRSELPWEDEFSYHVLTLRGDTLSVRNEWNVAMWRTADHTLVYHHQFDPLCPIMTTNDRMLELRKLGASVSSATANAASYNYYVNTAYYSSQFNQAMNNYRSTGDTSYLSSAQASYGLTRNAMAQNRALAGMQFGLAMSTATMQLGTAVIKQKIQVTSSMVYPQVDAVMKKHRIFDSGEHAIRLVGVQIGAQRFSALESVHEPTGRTRQVLLSPSQMPSGLTTFARSPMTAQELNGYYSAAMYLGHNYSTAVDLKRGRIFHYGPGLNVEEYVAYGQTAFLRGRLWRFDEPLLAGN